MRICIASSGLGTVQRGIETWADTLLPALQGAGIDATLFQGGGVDTGDRRVVLRCLHRFEPRTLRLVRLLSPLGGWRYGLGSGYQVEQSTFAWLLWHRIRREYDLLHVQDPWLALVMHRLNRLRLSRPRVVLAHGTEEDTPFLRRMGVLQHLAPCYADDWKPNQPRGQLAFGIPNFVDCLHFVPGTSQSARERLGLPATGLIFLCVAAIQRIHKRVDFLIREFHGLLRELDTPMTLVVAGGREAQSEGVMEEGRRLLGDRVRFLVGLSRAEMPHLYQAADGLVLASLHEMMPIAVLEALASGLPVICSETPVLAWMTAEAGVRGDIREPGSLIPLMRRLTVASERSPRRDLARRRAVELFSKEAVTAQIVAMYRQVLASP